MVEITPADLAWGDKFEMPPTINMFAGGKKDTFVRNGTAIFLLLEDAIRRFKPGASIEDLQVLDFGCGVGRVAMPFFAKYGRPTACVDPQKNAINYVKKVLPLANPQYGVEHPPLPFADGSFDVIYSISVWTHMNKEVADNWLREVRRLLRPGGLALISVSSYQVLEAHRRHPELSSIWADVTEDVLKRDGWAFRSRNYALMKEPYGEMVYDPDWLKSEWSKVIPVREYSLRVVGGVGRQDLVVMQKDA